MKDARGRKVEVGGWVCIPWPPLREMPAEMQVELPEVISGAVFDRVYEIVENEADPFIHIGDGIILEGHEFVTISGYEFAICAGCGLSWPVDPRSEEEEECPGCGALLGFTCREKKG